MKNQRGFAIAGLSMLLLIFMSFLGAAQSLSRERFPVGTYLEGDFNATFTKEGEIIVFSDELVKARGFYKLEGHTIIIKDRDRESQCSGEGKYKWRFDGKALTFVKLADACAGRARHLTSRAWQLVKREPK